MNEELCKNQVCFIICIINSELANLTLNSLNRINIPEGYNVEVRTIENELNVAKAYNEAISDCKAQYKIYLREGVEILNENILADLIELFEFDYKVGIVGVSGAEYIPVNCNINTTVKKFGKVFNKKEREVINWQSMDTKAKCVAALDDWLLATQYDIKWREDLFQDIDYLALSQCAEFKRHGYEALVIDQPKPWICLDDFFRIISLQNDNSKENFKNEYYKDVFPLVSILIPTHNRPEYLKIALGSVINQTYKNLDIVISDNSDDERTKNMILTYLKKDKRIRYFYHKSVSAENNHRILCDNIRGEYINWLMDDDYFALNKIEAMIDYYREYDNVTLVTSLRQFVDNDGNKLDYNICLKIKETCILKGDMGGQLLMKSGVNYIGEPTTPLLKVDYLNLIGKPYYGCTKYENVFFRYLPHWDIGTRKLYGMGDMMLWLNLLGKGDMVYVAEELSYFRIHPGQHQREFRDMHVVITLIGKFLVLHRCFANDKFLHDEETFFEILKHLNAAMKDFLNTLQNDVENLPEFLKCIEFSEQELSEQKILDVFNLYNF